MRYVFQDVTNSRNQRIIECPMDRISEETGRLARLGWARVFTPPNIVVVPGFWEAYQESVDVADDPYLGQGKPKHDRCDEVGPIRTQDIEDVVNDGSLG